MSSMTIVYLSGKVPGVKCDMSGIYSTTEPLVYPFITLYAHCRITLCAGRRIGSNVYAQLSSSDNINRHTVQWTHMCNIPSSVSWSSGSNNLLVRSSKQLLCCLLLRAAIKVLFPFWKCPIIKRRIAVFWQ